MIGGVITTMSNDKKIKFEVETTSGSSTTIDGDVKSTIKGSMPVMVDIRDWTRMRNLLDCVCFNIEEYRRVGDTFIRPLDTAEIQVDELRKMVREIEDG